jgi:hypothetical protein
MLDGTACLRGALSSILLLALAPTPANAASYPPQYHFRTISTDQVSVHFHEGFESMARQAASIATEILSGD